MNPRVNFPKFTHSSGIQKASLLNSTGHVGTLLPCRPCMQTSIAGHASCKTYPSYFLYLLYFPFYFIFFSIDFHLGFFLFLIPFTYFVIPFRLLLVYFLYFYFFSFLFPFHLIDMHIFSHVKSPVPLWTYFIFFYSFACFVY